MILAIDLGTTSCKVVALDAGCRIVHSARLEYPISTPERGWAEQTPEAWWAAVRETVRAVASSTGKAGVSAIGLSGQMHGLVALDGDRRVLRPAILWNDQRAEPHCRAIHAAVGGREALAALTNNAMLPCYVGGKLLWLREHEPEVFGRIRTILLPKDYVRLRLCGEIATDPSDASGTGLFDVRARTWARGLLDQLQLPPEWMPTVLASHEVAGRLLPGAAEELGLAAGTPVVAGGGDAVLATVGANALSEEEVLVVIGTGGNVTTTLASCPPLPGPSFQVFCHAVPGRWVAYGVPLNAGIALRWYRDVFRTPGGGLASRGDVESYEALSERAATSSPGSGGLMFLPYLQGECCPHTDPDARACFLGLSLATREADVVRSILEGVALAIRDVFETLTRWGAPRQRVVMSGGGARSPIWRQILADTFGCEVVTREFGEDASALGAGIVAGVGTGMWGSVEEASAHIAQTSALRPDPATAAYHRERFELFRSLYPALARFFAASASSYLPAIPSSSTSNTSVAPPGMTPPAPQSP